MKNNIRIHWRLIQGGEETTVSTANQNDQNKSALPDLENQIAFCQLAEKLGIHSVLVDLNYGKPDPIMLTMALARKTESLGFIIAVRSGLLSPTLFVQQINTLSTFSKGRLLLNVVAGHSPKEQRYYGDFLDHKERYSRTFDFLNICHQFWDGKEIVNHDGKYLKVEGGKINTPYVSETENRPFIFVAGNSSVAEDLATEHADCWMQLASSPKEMAYKIEKYKTAHKPIGLRMSVICRQTKEEAIEVANALIAPLKAERMQQFVKETDAVSIKSGLKSAQKEWLDDVVWAGAVPFIGPTSIALVGSYEDVALKIKEYQAIGVQDFILSGWPKKQEMVRFAENVMPLLNNETTLETSSPKELGISLQSESN